MVMTKAEAKHEMGNGKKLTHRHLLDNEFIEKTKDGKVLESYVHDYAEFWFDKMDVEFDTGWSIFEDK